MKRYEGAVTKINKTRCRPSKGDELFGTSQNTSQIKFRTFLKKKSNFRVLMLVHTREDLSIDASITNVGLIFMKLW